MPDGPDDDAYSRVTNPQRFAPLHDIARQTVDELLARFDASAADDHGVVTNGESLTIDRRLRVTPLHGGGGTIVVELTPFPGLIVRLGRWHSFNFPQCGCDACDEQVPDIEVELVQIVAAFVNGHFAESLTSARLSHQFSGPGRTSSGWSAVFADSPLRAQPAESIEWPAWPLRPDVYE